MGSNGTPGVDERPAGSAGATRPAKRRLLVGAAVVLGTLSMTGCSSATTEQWKRLGQPEGASDRTESVRSLWIGAWFAALIVAVMVWG
ncbi:cytochrome c oxidase subunit II, partial [Kribbella sp. NPDC054772]